MLTITLIITLPLYNNFTDSVSAKSVIKSKNFIIGINHKASIKIKKGYKYSDFHFSSEDKSIACVSEKGVISAKKTGNVNITCTLKNTSKTFVCCVTVRKLLKEITLNAEYVNLYKKGETFSLVATTSPQKATIKKLKYTSGNKKVVTVTNNGLITAVSPGTTTITVASTDGSNLSTSIEVKFVNSGYDSPLGIEYQKNIPHGTIKTVKYYSKVTKKYMKAVIYTPPKYTEDKTYNVLYLLHGKGCNQEQWEGLGAKNIMDYLYSENKIKDMILVMPDCYVYTNSTGKVVYTNKVYDTTGLYINFETEMTTSLMPYINKKYSVYTDCEHTALGGLSMGGSEACSLGLKRTDLFSYIAMFSPAYSNIDYVFTQTLTNDIHTNHPPKFVWLSIGSADTVVNYSTEMIKKSLDSDEIQSYFTKNNTQYIYYKMPTVISHSNLEWQNGLYNFAQRIF